MNLCKNYVVINSLALLGSTSCQNQKDKIGLENCLKTHFTMSNPKFENTQYRFTVFGYAVVFSNLDTYKVQKVYLVKTISLGTANHVPK